MGPAEQLRELEVTLRERLGALGADERDIVDARRDSNADDEHDPEGATLAFELSQVSSLARAVRSQLAEVAAARGRLADGSYGRCERCGAEIGAVRLEARPTATRCIGCASR